MADSSNKGNIVSSIIGNMALAHEMIMTDNFQLKSLNESDENSLERHVHDIVHNAFWDVLSNEVSADPPQYNKALNLLAEMKHIMLELLLPNHEILRKEIEEVLDDDLIGQQVSYNTFDINACAQFVLNTLSKLCAPVRDEKILELKEKTDLVLLLRGTFELLNMMKLDMANYEIQSLKPILIKQAVQYEQEKFAEYLKRNSDGLKLTTLWLQEGFQMIQSMKKADSSKKIMPAVVISHSYLPLMDMDNKIYPETLLMDEVRLKELRDSLDKIVYTAAILAVSLHFFGAHLASDQTFVSHLKDTVITLLSDGVRDESLLESISMQIIADGGKELDKKGLSKKKEEDQNMLKGQIKDLSKPDNQLKKLIKARIRDSVLLLMTSQVWAPITSAALLHVHKELKSISEKFVRIIIHNRNVYQSYYHDIIDRFQSETETLSQENT